MSSDLKYVHDPLILRRFGAWRRGLFISASATIAGCLGAFVSVLSTPLGLRPIWMSALTSYVLWAFWCFVLFGGVVWLCGLTSEWRKQRESDASVALRDQDDDAARASIVRTIRLATLLSPILFPFTVVGWLAWSLFWLGRSRYRAVFGRAAS